MRVKKISMLAVLLIAFLLMIGVSDSAIAKQSDKTLIDYLRDIFKPIPTPQPVPAPGNLPYPTPAPPVKPAPGITPASGSATQPMPFTIEYTWQNSWPGYDATPVPQNGLSSGEMAVSSLLSEAVILASPASDSPGQAGTDELTYPGKDLRGYIILLIGLGCICYLMYLGYAMIKK